MANGDANPRSENDNGAANSRPTLAYFLEKLFDGDPNEYNTAAARPPAAPGRTPYQKHKNRGRTLTNIPIRQSLFAVAFNRQDAYSPMQLVVPILIQPTSDNMIGRTTGCHPSRS